LFKAIELQLRACEQALKCLGALMQQLVIRQYVGHELFSLLAVCIHTI
jgi:hypothetical protein